MKLLSPTARAERRLAICVALIAGYVDGFGIRAFATYVSFMSGNTTQTGVMLGQGKFVSALPFALAIASFVTGSFAGTWLGHSGLRHSRRLLFAAVAALLTAALAVMHPGSVDAKIGSATLCLAMGRMNTSLTQIGSETVSLTFVTGNLNRLGSHLALGVRGEPLRDAQGPWDTHFARARLLANVWSGFLVGAMLSGIASVHFGAWAPVPPILILLTLVSLHRVDAVPAPPAPARA